MVIGVAGDGLQQLLGRLDRSGEHLDQFGALQRVQAGVRLRAEPDQHCLQRPVAVAGAQAGIIFGSRRGTGPSYLFGHGIPAGSSRERGSPNATILPGGCSASTEGQVGR